MGAVRADDVLLVLTGTALRLYGLETALSITEDGGIGLGDCGKAAGWYGLGREPL